MGTACTKCLTTNNYNINMYSKFAYECAELVLCKLQLFSLKCDIFIYIDLMMETE